MANCGNCGSNRQICSCVFVEDGSTTEVIGNGSIVSPISFNKSEGPTPRPLAQVTRIGTDPAVTVPISTQTVIPFTRDNLNRGNGINLTGTGMVDLAGFPTRITCAVAGKYLLGGFLRMDDNTAVGANNRVDLYLSQGIPAGANVWASENQLRIAQNPNQAENWLSVVTLVAWTVGNYMEMYTFSTMADATFSGASAHMWAIWMDE